MATIILDAAGASAAADGNASRRGRRTAAPNIENVQQVRQRSDPGLKVPNFAATHGGEDLGRGLLTFGVGLERAAEREKAALERQQKEFDAIKTTEAEIAYKRVGMEEWRRVSTEEDSTDPTFMANYRETLDKKWKEIEGRLPPGVSPLAREKLRLTVEANRDGMVDAAGRFQNQQNAKKSLDLIGQQSNMWAAQASRDPDFLETILAEADEGLKPFAGTLTPDMERDARAKVRQQIIQSTVSGLVKNDRYADAEKIMASGKFDADLGAEALRSINADIHRGKGVARQEIRELANDHLASLSATGQGVPGLSERASKILDPKDAADFKARESTARQVHSLGQQLKFATPEEMKAGLDAIAPKAGSTRFADEQRIHAGLTNHAGQILKARDQDPAGYAMQAPEVAEAFKAAGNNPALLPGAINKSLALQSQMGIPDHERRVLTKAQAENQVGQLSALPPEKMADQLQGMAAAYGKYWPGVYRELVANKLPQDGIVLGTMDRPEDAVARKNLAAAIQTGRKTLTDNLGPQVKGAIDTALHSAMEPWARAELSRGAHDANVQTVRSSAEMLAYYYASRGMTPEKAAEQAARETALDRYDILDQPNFSMYAPKGLGGQIGETGTRILSGLKPEDLMDPGGMGKLTPQERQKQYLGSVKRGSWVLDGQGDGAILLDEIGQPAMSADTGKPIAFKFRDMDALKPTLPSGPPSITDPRNPLRNDAPTSDRVPPPEKPKPQKTGSVLSGGTVRLSQAEIEQAIENGPPYPADPNPRSSHMQLTPEQSRQSGVTVLGRGSKADN